MPKLKTHRGAHKRLRKTATGKYKFKKTFSSHLLTGKPSKRMRQLMQPGIIEGAKATKSIRRLLPND